MKIPFVMLISVLALAGCASDPAAAPRDPVISSAKQPETTPDGTSTAATFDRYKLELAQRITEVNSTKIHLDQPQALLRSVIVIRYMVDARGELMRSDIVRTNRDHAAETTALATLRASAPFPKPAAHLLQRGRVDITETWLFNNDGRFQLRSLAQQQLQE